MVGSQKCLLRARHKDGTIRCRYLEGFEYMRLAGWGDHHWSKGPLQFTNPIEWHETLARMSGNAWSGFQYAQVQMAVIATCGKFLRNPGEDSPATECEDSEDEDEEDEEDDNEDQDEPPSP